MAALFGDRILHWGGLPEHAMRMARLAGWFSVVSPVSAVQFLQETLALVRARDEEARRLWLATIDWLERTGVNSAPVEAWRVAAQHAGLAEVAYVLLDEGPSRSLGEEDDGLLAPGHPDLAELTLGEKKARARIVGPADLHKFHSEQDPQVLRILFAQPAMTEGAVVRWLARRPLVPGVVAALFASPRWLAAPAIQRSLILNPWVSGRVAMKLLPLADVQTMREAAAAEDLGVAVRRWAAQLLRLQLG